MDDLADGIDHGHNPHIKITAIMGQHGIAHDLNGAVGDRHHKSGKSKCGNFSDQRKIQVHHKGEPKRDDGSFSRSGIAEPRLQKQPEIKWWQVQLPERRHSVQR